MTWKTTARSFNTLAKQSAQWAGQYGPLPLHSDPLTTRWQYDIF